MTRPVIEDRHRMCRDHPKRPAVAYVDVDYGARGDDYCRDCTLAVVRWAAFAEQMTVTVTPIGKQTVLPRE